MPIRKEMRDKYPPPKEWKALRAEILQRASDRCECVGECDSEHFMGRCDVPNGVIGKRYVDPAGVVHWYQHDGCSLCLGGDDECKSARVVLTISHRDHNPENNDPDNLRALCQRCHLRYDRHEHAKNAAETRRRKADDVTGQQRLGGVR